MESVNGDIFIPKGSDTFLVSGRTHLTQPGFGRFSLSSFLTGIKNHTFALSEPCSISFTAPQCWQKVSREYLILWHFGHSSNRTVPQAGHEYGLSSSDPLGSSNLPTVLRVQNKNFRGPLLMGKSHTGQKNLS